ncbi:MAG: KamA family radical SAM protein [Nanoarchaeota archaeon]|nr:KamA family radical SAM protein [Nanoarchaeota archaeon]MBU1103721.1 KamA family radical SAM protein [Nanoarchaeota archaeon]
MINLPKDYNFERFAEEIKKVSKVYPMNINPYYFSLIKKIDGPIWKQCIPSIKEIEDNFGEEDPLNEESENQIRENVPSLITHRYPDRVLFLVSNKCAMYCRFCTRKRKVGDDRKNPKWEEIQKAIGYIKNHEEIRDVLISGGDPFMLGDSYLDKLLKRVYEIIHYRKNGIIRIGTRIPCVLPQRITPNLCNILKKYHPIYLNTHFNHPLEITEESRKACGMLVDSGIPVGNQTVLLRGVNDDIEVMKELMQGLVSMRVRPYYLYQCDPVKGANHFRTDVRKGLEIYKALRGHTSGLCVPTFVIDSPGGGGKIPLLPEYVLELNDKEIILKNYEGKEFRYPQINLNQTPKSSEILN